MHWNSMKLSVKLPLTIAALLLLMGAAAVAGFFQLNRALDTFRTDVATAVQQERSVSAINLAFREQIQNWKNTLLRGKDPDNLKKNWDAFEGRSIKVACQDLPPGGIHSVNI